MAKKVEQVWAAFDGELFRTEWEAEQYEASIQLAAAMYSIARYKTPGLFEKHGQWSLNWPAENFDGKPQHLADQIIKKLNMYGFKIVAMTNEERTEKANRDW